MDKQEKIQVLSDLIAFTSVNDNEVEVAEYIHDLLAKNNIDSKIIPVSGQRANLVAEIGENGPVLGFSGHSVNQRITGEFTLKKDHWI